jgi:hypothetical protein
MNDGDVVAHLETFMACGTLPKLDVLAFDVVVLGVAHEACRRWLAGAPLDPEWLRATLPRMAWASLEQT